MTTIAQLMAHCRKAQLDRFHRVTTPYLRSWQMPRNTEHYTDFERRADWRLSPNDLRHFSHKLIKALRRDFIPFRVDTVYIEPDITCEPHDIEKMHNIGHAVTFGHLHSPVYNKRFLEYFRITGERIAINNSYPIHYAGSTAPLSFCHDVLCPIGKLPPNRLHLNLNELK